MSKPAAPPALPPLPAAWLGLAGCALLFACARSDERALEKPADAVVAEGAHAPHVHQWHRWSEKLTQGAQPENDRDFAELKAEGVTTILSVDGALPDVEGARRHGLRYVHVPIGYDGVTADEAKRIVKAVKESEGTVFIHCHHGLHRGPAAAGVARIALGEATPEQAVKDLAESGCSPSYTGLYRDVGAFRPPSDEELASLPPVPEAVKPSGFREVMTHVDQSWEYVKASKPHGFATDPDHPDVEPAHEVGMIENHLRLSLDLEDSKALGADFLHEVERSRAAAEALETAIRAGDAMAAEAAYKDVAESCTRCHKLFRN